MKTLTAGRHAEILNERLPGVVRWPIKGVIKGYRQLTAGLRTLPDFLIIGSRKCGTTALYRYLIEHPCVMPALTKEVLFFGEQYHRGESWYRRHFPLCMERRLWSRVRGSRVITGEATPSYFNNPRVPERVHRLDRSLKLIVVLRNPVAAVYSAYQFGIKRGAYTEASNPFEKLVESELEQLQNGPIDDHNLSMVLPRYVYINHLKRWHQTFPKEQIHLVCLESFSAAPQQHFDQVCDFLKLPRFNPSSFKPQNTNGYGPMATNLRDRLIDFFEPHNQRLSEYEGMNLPWSYTADGTINGRAEIAA